MFKKGSYFYYALSNGMFYFSWGMFGSILSIYLSAIGCNAVEISTVVSASSIFAIISQPIMGMIADRIKSPKIVSIVSGVLVAVFGLLFAYSKNMVFLFLFNGATQGLMNGITALTDRLATGSPYPFGTIRVWGSVLYAVACQVSGYVFENISPKANFYIFAVGIILMIIGFLNIYDVKPSHQEKEHTISFKKAFSILFKNHSFVMFVLIYILYQGVVGTQGIYQQLMMSDLGATPALIGTTFLFSTLSELPAVLFSDKIFKRFSYKSVMFFVFMMTLIRVLWYSTCPSPTWIMYAFFFQGTTSIVFMLIQVKIIMEIVDEQYINTAYGIANMLAKGVSTVIFQFICGKIVEVYGYSILYYFYALVILIIIAMTFRFKIPKKESSF